MKVRMLTLTEERIERRDYKGALEIEVDGKVVASFWEGEPEDASLYRDYADCMNIDSLMKMAYDAGKAGEPFIVENGNIEEY